MHQAVADFKPTSPSSIGHESDDGGYTQTSGDTDAMIDLKTENITAMLTSLMPGAIAIERTETTISSLMDTGSCSRTRHQRPSPPRLPNQVSA